MNRIAYCGTRISPHMIRDVNGNLVCTGVPIARTGYQEYKRNEVDKSSGDDSIVNVMRPVSEVTSAATIASFEGVPITLRHPAKFITPETYSWSVKGHAQHIRVGPKDRDGNITLIADLHIKDKSLIDAIEQGVRDLSCGYTYSLVQLSDGSWAQSQIRGNHIAVVESGRAGTTQILDASPEDEMNKIDRLVDAVDKLVQCLAQRESQEDDDDLNEEEMREAKRKGAVKSYDEEHQFEEALNDRHIPLAEQGGEPINPTVARDALASLRKIRETVEAKGTDAEIASYNRAIRQLKAQAALCERFDPRTSAYDSRSQRLAAAESFEKSASRFHRKPLKVNERELDDEHSAADAETQEMTFDEAVAKARDASRAKWMPKKRV